MRKFLTLSLGALLALFGTACSNDDVLDPDPEPIVQDDAQENYIAVSIKNVGYETTRAASNYEDGTTSESAVNNIEFFFFDGSGNFMAEGKVHSNLPNFTGNSSENIEKQGTTYVGMDIENGNYPSYLITVLNAPNIDLEEGDNIGTLENKLMDDFCNGSYFIMSTTTYKQSTQTGATGEVYCATALSSSDWCTSLEEARKTDGSVSTVDVYVERLAAKVRINFSTLKRYKDGVIKLGTRTVQDGTSTGEELPLYAKVIGWGLNATSRQSYLMKDIDPTWDLGFYWNHPAYFRSYWAKSVLYGEDKNYPEYYGDKSTGLENDKNGYYKYDLNYISATDAKKNNINGPQYCHENTNTAEIINKSHIPGTATCVLILCQLYKDNDCTEKVTNLIKMAGTYYYEDQAKQFIYNSIVGTDTYKNANGVEMSINDVQWTSHTYLNGHVTLKVEGDWYLVTNGVQATESSTASLNEKFMELNSNQECPAIRYKDGLTYYYAPINHLNYYNQDGNGTQSEDEYKEGYYGVVRNHIYDIYINGFKSTEDTENKIPNPSTPTGKDPDGDTPDPDDPDDVPNNPVDPENPEDNTDDDNPPYDNDDPVDPGHGVEDPDEPIVPNPEEDANYWISTQINILSWRVVSQYVKI